MMHDFFDVRLAVSFFVAMLAAYFVATTVGMGFRKITLEINARLIKTLKARVRSCLCDRRYNAEDMVTHIQKDHPDFDQDKATRIMMRFREKELF